MNTYHLRKKFKKYGFFNSVGIQIQDAYLNTRLSLVQYLDLHYARIPTVVGVKCDIKKYQIDKNIRSIKIEKKSFKYYIKIFTAVLFFNKLY